MILNCSTHLPSCSVVVTDSGVLKETVYLKVSCLLDSSTYSLPDQAVHISFLCFSFFHAAHAGCDCVCKPV